MSKQIKRKTASKRPSKVSQEARKSRSQRKQLEADSSVEEEVRLGRKIMEEYRETLERLAKC
jgi:hypothetical protein